MNRHLRCGLGAAIFAISIYGPGSWATTFAVDSDADATDALPGDGICDTGAGVCTLRAAVQEANALEGADVISLPAGTYTLTFGGADEDAAASGDLDILDSLEIRGGDPLLTIIDGATTDRIFDIIDPAVTVALSNATLQNGTVTVGSGGCIRAFGSLSMHNVTVSGCRADVVDSKGGGLYLQSGHHTFELVEISANHAVFGGGLFVDSGTLSLHGAKIDNNHSLRHGGGIHIGEHNAQLPPADVEIINSEITNNSIDGASGGVEGAGLFVTSRSVVYIADSTFASNSARGGCTVCYVNGGAISANGKAVLNLNGVTLESNSAAQWGGAMYTTGGVTATIESSIIRFNQTLRGASVQNPLDAGMGGALAADFNNANGDSIITVRNSLLQGNSAYFGGAAAGNVVLENTTVSGNIAQVGGAGLMIPTSDHDKASLLHVTFADNTILDATSTRPSNIDNRASFALRIKNSVLEHSGANPNCAGPTISLGGNVFSDDTCNAIASDRTGSDPALVKPLANNGGNSETYDLDPQSPALGLVPASACADVDQRYHYRDNSTCDAGAFETASQRAQSGELAFGAAAYAGDEDGGDITVEIQRTGGAEGKVSIDYVIREGSAQTPADFTTTQTRGTLTWNDGDAAAKTITITPVAERKIEADETVMIHLRNPVGGAALGANAQTTVTINNDDTVGTFNFEKATYQHKEGAGNLVLSITRAGSVGEAEVSVKTAAGSANEGDDYEGLDTTVTFADGESSKQVEITVNDDRAVEEDEDFTVTLTTSTPDALIGNRGIATVTILSDDAVGTFSLAQDAVDGYEDDGVVVLTILREGDVGDVTICLQSTADTATANEDFEPLDTCVDFADGETEKQFELKLLADDLVEEGETLSVEISTETAGALVGAPATAVVTLLDGKAPSAPATPGGDGGGGGGGAFNPLLGLVLAGVVSRARRRTLLGAKS